jgi:hypothetical protein
MHEEDFVLAPVDSELRELPNSSIKASHNCVLFFLTHFIFSFLSQKVKFPLHDCFVQKTGIKTMHVRLVVRSDHFSKSPSLILCERPWDCWRKACGIKGPLCPSLPHPPAYFLQPKGDKPVSYECFGQKGKRAQAMCVWCSAH